MGDDARARLSGALAGLANGIFGGGGGMVFLPLMSRSALSGRQLFATCVGVVFPACAVSAGVYLLRASISPAEALPYLLGGLSGGFLGGALYGRVSPLWLRRLFAAFLLYGGVRYLL